MAAPSGRFRLGFGRASVAQLVISTRQLATLVKAGMPLLRALRTVSDQLEPGELRQIFSVVAGDVEAGGRLSEALSRHPRTFPTFYVNMIRAGEVGGLLDEILKRLAELMEKQQRIRQRVKSALMYPAFVMLAAVSILVILMAFVVPTFLGMFSELGSALPLPTQILVVACTLLRRAWWLVLLGIFGLGSLTQALLRSPGGKRLYDRILLRFPIIGSLIHRLLIARFARTFGTLLMSGVPILEALSTVRATVSNSVIDDALQDVERSLKTGESLTRPMELSGAFPPLVSRMVALGEETGQLDRMLVQLADSYEEEVDVQLGGLTQLLEPLLIVVVGGIVGFIVIAMFMPLLSLTKILG
ncbi:MAG: type II secretion system F family protein [Candidatus Omnitrophica bacterium]|nr:type II secretion system F family protein [Candidatus Omnitrophota bacterium]